MQILPCPVVQSFLISKTPSFAQSQGIAFVAYAMDVTWTRAQPNMITGYMATVPGLLKGLETIVACVIFIFLSNTSLYLHQPALEWPLLHLLHPSSRGHATEAG